MFPARWVQQHFGNKDAALTAWVATILVTVPIPYFMFRNWRFRLEMTDLELIGGRILPKRFLYQDIRRISVCPCASAKTGNGPSVAEGRFQ